ncbi:hypothetical protein ACFE04_023856 [Oxalis oulophora]
MSNNNRKTTASGVVIVDPSRIPNHAKKTVQSIKEIVGEQHTDDDIYSVLQECNMDPNETAQKLLYLDTFHEVKSKRGRRKESSAVVTPGRGARGGGQGNNFSNFNSADAGSGRNAPFRRANGVNHVKERGSKQNKTNTVPQTTKTSAKPTLASGSTKPEVPAVTVMEKKLGSTVAEQSVSGVYSSASDPVLVPSTSQNPGTVGTIGIQQKESGIIQESKLAAVHDTVAELPESEKTAFETFDSTNDDGESKVAESNLESSSSAFSSPQPTTILVKVSEPVRFPSHFQVPEAVKNGLTFGSFEVNLVVGTNHVNDTAGDIDTHTIESSQENDEILGEPSPREQGVSSIFQGDNPDYSNSTSLDLENVLSSDDNVTASADLKSVESKPEMLTFPGGHPNPHVQNFSNYSFGFMPTLPGAQFVQYEGAETQSGNQQVPSSASQPPAVQSSTSTSPQTVLLRQPYHPNYIPYAHYLSPFYMPQIQQFINPNGLPQQPSSGNVYIPPNAAAAPGGKFPPPPFKIGTNSPVGNPPPPHMGVPSGYSSYTPSPVGFNPVSAMASGSSASNEDLLASQLKESHIYTTGPMSEGSPLWIPAPPQDLSRMQVSSLYNLPIQGQHLAFSPQQAAGHGVFTGIYQTPHNANPLMQQSQPTPTAPETVVRSSSGAFQQPQLAQMNWNSNY